ncbi:MAG: hypothetical protein J7L07_02835 [Candidatus Odinarchaeota archaeon]|nr:hypothetical protein [Candidatus Odinarchaeota archaeon]
MAENLGVMGKSTMVDGDIKKIVKFYATLKGLSMHDIYTKALIHYVKHIWQNEFDDEDRNYVTKKLKLSKKTIEILRGD